MDHLRQLPAEEVERVVCLIEEELLHIPYGLRQELNAFAETHTVHDAWRVIKALQYAYDQPGLAHEVLAILPTS